MGKLCFHVSNVVMSSCIFSILFSMILDFVVIDFSHSFILNKLKTVEAARFLLWVFNALKKIKLPCYDVWLVTGETIPGFRNFVDYKHLIHAKSKYKFKMLQELQKEKSELFG